MNEYFAVRVKDDSMDTARIHEGDILVFRRQETVENGEIAVVLSGDGDVVVRRFRRSGQAITLLPQSTNPVHKPRVFDLLKSRVQVLGKVVKSQKSF